MEVHSVMNRNNTEGLWLKKIRGGGGGEKERGVGSGDLIASRNGVIT